MTNGEDLGIALIRNDNPRLVISIIDGVHSLLELDKPSLDDLKLSNLGKKERDRNAMACLSVLHHNREQLRIFAENIKRIDKLSLFFSIPFTRDILTQMLGACRQN